MSLDDIIDRCRVAPAPKVELPVLPDCDKTHVDCMRHHGDRWSHHFTGTMMAGTTAVLPCNNVFGDDTCGKSLPVTLRDGDTLVLSWDATTRL